MQECFDAERERVAATHQQEIESWQNKCEALRKEVAAVEARLDEAREAMQALRRAHESEKASLKARIDELQASLDHAELEKKRLEQDVAAARETIEEREVKIRSLQNELDAAHSRYSELQRALEVKQQEISALEDELKIATQRMQDLLEEMERIRREAEEKYAALICQIEEITGQKVVVEDSLSVERTATSRLKSEVDRLFATIDSLRLVAEENERRGLKIAELEAIIAELRKLEDSAGRTYELEREVHRLQAVVKGLESSSLTFSEEWKDALPGMHAAPYPGSPRSRDVIRSHPGATSPRSRHVR